MKLLFTACMDCGAPSASPVGLCPDCETRRLAVGGVPKRRIRERVQSKRAA